MKTIEDMMEEAARWAWETAYDRDEPMGAVAIEVYETYAEMEIVDPDVRREFLKRTRGY